MRTDDPSEIRVAIAVTDQSPIWSAAMEGLPVEVYHCDNLDTLVFTRPDVLLVDAAFLQSVGIANIREQLPRIVMLAPASINVDVELPLPSSFDANVLARLLRTAMELAATRRNADHHRRMLAGAEQDLARLADIGVALSAERDLDCLLKRILTTAQDIASCDAASLFLLDEDVSPAELLFKLTLNDSLLVDFQESRFPATTQSISGYVALTGKSVVLDDVYALPSESPFQFNRDFDQATGYRGRSLCCIAMRDYKNRIVGVLQFINRKRDRDDRLTADNTAERVIAFDDRVMRPLEALASLSAVAIQTRMLIDSINNLFENFVQASVAAIEQRDPTTSGHSFRVADLSVALARALPNGARQDLAAFNPDARSLRELRYAALLHDFGKVGVREAVLVKAKKLYDGEFNALRYRLQLTRQRLRADAAERIIQLYQQGRGDESQVALIRAAFEKEAAQLDLFMKTIAESNEPTLLNAECKAGLDELQHVWVDDHDGKQSALLSPSAYEALSIARGSLTAQERLEIESHVTHTFNFLKMIPWTDELASIPDIAGKHHEKLNGSGYPEGVSADDIPLQSRVMAICDIYDALTASDRPYKRAAPEEVAVRILREDADRGMLDADMVDLFVGADIGAIVRGKTYPKVTEMAGAGFHHSVCDPDAHTG